jgi:LacI family transcriptional regulator, repressor for deo operon, udp, cdd, tsx, nupC, and nupG
VSGPLEMVHGRSRRAAWAATVHAAGVPEGPTVEADFSAEAGAAATRELLDLAEPPTAIVYANDLMAIAGLAVASSRGVGVPDQLSVIGYEDTELAAHVQPSLSSVSSDVIGWGQAAARRLLELVDQRPATAIELPAPRLVPRESSGPVPA